MKRLSLIIALTGLFALGAHQVRAMTPPQDTSAQDNGSQAKQDAKGAGKDVKNAAKKTGGAVKKGSKKAANVGAKA